MILGQIADAVMTAIREDDAATRAKVYVMAARRYRFIHDRALWNDVLDLLAVNVAAAQQEIIYPAQFERVIALRVGSRPLIPVDQPFLFATDPEIFDRSGTPYRFAESGSLAVRVAPTAEKLTFVSSAAGDTAKTVSIRGEHAGVEYDETVTLNGTTPVDSVHTYSSVRMLAKAATTGTVTVTGKTTAATLVTLKPADRERRHARVRLLETPTEASTVTALLKRACNPLVVETDATLIRGIDDALIALTTADAWQWKRHNQKAREFIDEGTALLAIAQRTEAWQQANQRQFLPADGLGADDNYLDY